MCLYLHVYLYFLPRCLYLPASSILSSSLAAAGLPPRRNSQWQGVVVIFGFIIVVIIGVIIVVILGALLVLTRFLSGTVLRAANWHQGTCASR